MKTIYSIFDSVGGFYSPVFQAENDKHAIRMFSEAFADRSHLADYTLWKLGTFDPDKGHLKTRKEPSLVLNGLSLEKGNNQ
ncbi:nonstructural protein [Microviridae sp.]|nr:nonstructural protein [Microviridae sp.]